MAFYDTILTYITDKERKLSTKTYVTIICLALIIVLDNIIGLSYHYSVDKKLTEINVIGQILKDTTLEKSTRKELLTLRQEILNKKYFYDQITDGVKSLFKKDVTPVHADKSTNIAETPRNNLWFLISSSGILLLFYFIMILVYPFIDKNNSFGQKLAIEIIIIVLGGLRIWLNYWLLGFIPKLGNTWTGNYILNFAIQILIFATSIVIIAREERKKKNSR
jgi:hypothetical protein